MAFFVARNPCNAGVQLARAVACSLALGAVTAPGVHAQQVLDDIVITANRTPSEINKVGSTVEVIDREDLDKHSQTYLKDYLSRLPGVTISQNGPPGSTPTIQIRGAHGHYVKVLIDGMDVTDAASPQAAASLEHIMVGDIERIEVLKGPQSTLYGSEAVGGVIAVTTRRAARGLSLRAQVEGGRYGTQVGGATVSYGTDRGDISFSAQGVRTDGFSAADENAGNSEADGYENRSFSGRGQYRVNDNLKVFFAARATNSRIELDGFSFDTGLPIDAIGESSTFALKAARGGGEVSFFEGRFVNTFAVQRIAIDRENFGAFPSVFESDRTRYEYKGVAKFSAAFTMMAGAERDEASAITTFFTNRVETMTNSLFAQALVEPITNLNLTAGVRRDEHSAFGNFDTWRITGAYFIPAWGTKLRATYGTAFRAPSLFELFDPTFGNAGLLPEESVGWDAGIDQTLANGRVTVSATYFEMDIDSLIQFTFPAGYANVAGKTERRGYELAAKARVADWLQASASYTNTEAKDDLGNRIARVPRHVVSLGLDAQPLDRMKVNVTTNIVRDTVDSFAFVLDNYVLVNAKVSYDISDQLTAYIRGENLLEQEYQTVRGFGTSDLALYAGLTLKLQQDTAAPVATPK